jgi:hypothetical protein
MLASLFLLCLFPICMSAPIDPSVAADVAASAVSTVSASASTAAASVRETVSTVWESTDATSMRTTLGTAAASVAELAVTFITIAASSLPAIMLLVALLLAILLCSCSTSTDVEADPKVGRSQKTSDELVKERHRAHDEMLTILTRAPLVCCHPLRCLCCCVNKMTLKRWFPSLLPLKERQRIEELQEQIDELGDELGEVAGQERAANRKWSCFDWVYFSVLALPQLSLLILSTPVGQALIDHSLRVVSSKVPSLAPFTALAQATLWLMTKLSNLINLTIIEVVGKKTQRCQDASVLGVVRWQDCSEWMGFWRPLLPYTLFLFAAVGCYFTLRCTANRISTRRENRRFNKALRERLFQLPGGRALSRKFML